MAQMPSMMISFLFILAPFQKQSYRVFYHLSRLYWVIPCAGFVFTYFDPEDENGSGSFFHIHKGGLQRSTALGDEPSTT